MGIRVAVAVCAVVAIGSACSGDDPSPSPLPSSPSVSPSSPSAAVTASPSAPTSTPAPTPPVQPALARQDSPAGAEAFARYWLTTLDYAYKTGDTAGLRAAGTCRGCIAQADAVDEIYRSGGHIEGGVVTVLGTSTVRHVKGSAALVQVDHRQAAGRTIAADGSATSQAARPQLSLLFTLGRRGGSWTTIAIQPLKES